MSGEAGFEVCDEARGARATPALALVECKSLSEFEGELSARTKVPPERAEEYYAWSEERLRQEVDRTARILKRFAQAVIDAMDDPANSNEFLRQLDLKAIARDHDWQALFASLREQGAEHDRHKHAAVIKYLQFLSFRKKLLSYIYAKKAGLDDTYDRWDPSLYAAPAGAEQRAAHHTDYVRLTLGEPVSVTLGRNARAELMLAGHMYRLHGLPAPSIVDQNGVMYFLRAGRNMVGRHPESDIVVDSDFRDVSRAHLIIEWAGGPQLTLTDLSTRGTFVAGQALDPA